MKKRFLSLLLVPTLLLVACKGAKISEEKAKELANKITEHTESLDGASFEMTVKVKSAEGKGENREENNITYTLSQDKNENIKLKVKGNDGDEKYDFVIYSVKNDKYEEVSYIKDYNLETKAYNEYVYAKNATDDYSSKTTSYSIHALAPAIIIAGLADPVKLMEGDDFSQEEVVEDGLTFKTDVNYYSNGEKNMTIEAVRKLIEGEPEEGDEVSIEYKYLITYDNLVFKKAVINGKSNYGNTSEVRASLEFKGVKIELPKNWESLLNK